MEINKKRFAIEFVVIISLVTAYVIGREQFLYYKYNELNCTAYSNKHPYKNGFKVVRITFGGEGVMEMYEDSNGRKLYATQFDRLECE